ncbi:Elongation factor P [Parvicella tangerina]|uniref:Elongation factor P n=2 Tax=Parvicella tangerina TaxID=2829795 RepID=A0A916JLY3_9FLAO|nr:Elongation factor P [Parvicella tangerina]
MHRPADSLIFVPLIIKVNKMANTSDIKNGVCMNLDGKLVQVIEFQHVKPGKGPAFVRTKLRNIETGRVVDHTFSAGHKIDIIRIENRSYQYLYQDGSFYVFMNTDTFEQVNIEENMIDKKEYLKEGIVCSILFHAEEENPLVVELPQFIETEVTYTEPGIKGDTATNTMKPATIDTGAEVKVPLFIDNGDKIKVDIQKGQYVERIKD